MQGSYKVPSVLGEHAGSEALGLLPGTIPVASHPPKTLSVFSGWLFMTCS